MPLTSVMCLRQQGERSWGKSKQRIIKQWESERWQEVLQKFIPHSTTYYKLPQRKTGIKGARKPWKIGTTEKEIPAPSSLTLSSMPQWERSRIQSPWQNDPRWQVNWPSRTMRPLWNMWKRSWRKQGRRLLPQYFSSWNMQTLSTAQPINLGEKHLNWGGHGGWWVEGLKNIS